MDGDLSVETGENVFFAESLFGDVLFADVLLGDFFLDTDHLNSSLSLR